MYKILPILLFAFLFAEEKGNNKYFPQSYHIAVDSFFTLHPDVYIRGINNYTEFLDFERILLVREIESRLNSIIDINIISFSVELEILDSAHCNIESICLPDSYSYIVEDSTMISSFDNDSIFTVYWNKKINNKVALDYNKHGIHIFPIREKTSEFAISHVYHNNYYNPKLYEYKIITSKINVKAFHDEKIDKTLQNNFIKLIHSTHPSLPYCDDCISFTSVDMDSLRGVNKTVKSTISLNRDDIYDDSWAVIIGIDKYKYSDQL
ncbi:uncharacterized protein METZ01_LOCUS402892, partial [marine metagenome]